jgi:hypothetical protein
MYIGCGEVIYGSYKHLSPSPLENGVQREEHGRRSSAALQLFSRKICFQYIIISPFPNLLLLLFGNEIGFPLIST